MITTIDSEEREYEALRKLGQKLHIPIPEAFWELEVRDRDGKIVQYLKQRSHSWVRNAYNMFFTNSGLAAAHSSYGTHIVDVNGTTREVSGGPIYLRTYTEAWKGAAADDDAGIVVGSGTNAENFESYALQTRITEGTGAGQLSYVATDDPIISTVGTTKSVQWVRYFNNNSGSDVNVNEVGLYTYRTWIAGTIFGPPGWMSCRDKLASTVTVPNTGQLKVTYTIQLTYPA